MAGGGATRGGCGLLTTSVGTSATSLGGVTGRFIPARRAPIGPLDAGRVRVAGVAEAGAFAAAAEAEAFRRGSGGASTVPRGGTISATDMLNSIPMRMLTLSAKSAFTLNIDSFCWAEAAHT